MFIDVMKLSDEERIALGFELVLVEKRDKVYSEENLKKYDDRLKRQELNWEKQQIQAQIEEYKAEELKRYNAYLEMNKYYYNDE